MNKISRYMEKVTNRIYKYGLQYPLIEDKLSKDECKNI